jgi:hypothetical protein
MIGVLSSPPCSATWCRRRRPPHPGLLHPTSRPAGPPGGHPVGLGGLLPGDGGDRPGGGSAGRGSGPLPGGVRAKNWITDIIEINVTNLAGVPSIVYGLLALGIFVPTFGFGQSILTAGLTLALLILPVVIVATREAIRAIPVSIREGARCLRRHPLAVVRDHTLPYRRRASSPA